MPTKFGKRRKPLPGFKVDPEKARAWEEEDELRRQQKTQKAAEKRLRAQGFEMGKFTNYIKNLTG